MKKFGCFSMALLISLPLLYAIAYVVFPGVRPQPSPHSIFLRVTNLAAPPASLADLKVHELFDPLMGDGSALISFSLSQPDGQQLVRSLHFDTVLQANSRFHWYPIPVPISNPAFARYTEGVRHGEIIANPERTRFVWYGGGF